LFILFIISFDSILICYVVCSFCYIFLFRLVYALKTVLPDYFSPYLFFIFSPIIPIPLFYYTYAPIHFKKIFFYKIKQKKRKRNRNKK